MSIRQPIYSEIYEYDRLLAAYNRVKDNEQHTDEAIRFFLNIEENLINIQNHLIHKSYEPGNSPFQDFLVEASINSALKELTNECGKRICEDTFWLIGLFRLKDFVEITD